MIRSFAFTTQGRLYSKDIDLFLMPTLLADTNLFLWVDLEQAAPEDSRRILEGVFRFHPLTIEDCLSVSPTPKVEEYHPKEGDRFAPHLFMVIHAVDYSRRDGVFATSELNFFLGKNFLVTYHDVPMKSVQLTADRSVHGTIHIARAPDRLAHNLLDAIVENYKPALDELALEISDLEQDVIRSPHPRLLERIVQLKKEVLHLRQIIGPQREVMSRFARGEFKLIRPHLVPYYRNVYNSLSQIAELAHSYTDSMTGLLQVYLSMSSNQTAEVVKLLTLITIITTPLMMVGTWYGMNFNDMPELKAAHGYVISAVLVVVSTIGTYWYFKRKGWLN